MEITRAPARNDHSMSTASTVAPKPGAALPTPAAAAFWKPASEEPIRAELYSLESLEAYARQLAAAARAEPQARADGQLLRRFRQNGRILVDARRRIAAVTQGQAPLTP